MVAKDATGFFFEMMDPRRLGWREPTCDEELRTM